MIYKVTPTSEAEADFVRLAKSEPKVYAKAVRFIEELKVHPKTGLGHPEPLKGKPEGRWSREITSRSPALRRHRHYPSHHHRRCGGFLCLDLLCHSCNALQAKRP